MTKILSEDLFTTEKLRNGSNFQVQLTQNNGCQETVWALTTYYMQLAQDWLLLRLRPAVTIFRTKLMVYDEVSLMKFPNNA